MKNLLIIALLFTTTAVVAIAQEKDIEKEPASPITVVTDVPYVDIEVTPDMESLFTRINGELQKIDILITDLEVKRRVSNFVIVNMGTSGMASNGFTFLGQFYTNAPAEKVEMPAVKAKRAATKKGFNFLGDHYTDLPEEQVVLPQIKNNSQTFEFLGEEYRVLPAEKNDIPQLKEKQTFNFLGDEYEELPAENDPMFL